jgi:hypothetical protein
LIKNDNVPQAGKTSLRGLITSLTLQYSNEGDKLIFIDNWVRSPTSPAPFPPLPLLLRQLEQII